MTFLLKPHFSERVLCPCEMFYWNTFRLDIGICIVHALIFIKKYLVNWFAISFNEFLKTLISVILAMLTNLSLVFFLLLSKVVNKF